MTDVRSPAAPTGREDPNLELALHFASVARLEFEPAAYTRRDALGASEPVEKYLRAASWELSYVSLLLERASQASGDWRQRPGSLAEQAFHLRVAINRASEALANGWTGEAAKYTSAVAMCWQDLRNRQVDIEALGEDVQRAATRKGEGVAEEELRALAAAGSRPYRDDWSAEVQMRLAITQRGAQRVWELVSKEFPHLSSTKGVPKRRRMKP